MADKPQTREDFENMSDEEFMKLSEHDYSGNIPEGETSLTSESNNEEPIQQDDNSEGTDGSDTSTDGGELDDSGNQLNPGTSEGEEEGQENPEGGSQEEDNDPDGENKSGSGEEDLEKAGQQSEPDPEEEGKTPTKDGDKPVKGKETPAKAGYYKLPEGMDSAKVDAALGFYEIMTKPIKADGKDFTVRSPEDAVRLIQQGVNYSRRMQEIKPMKAINRMLSDQGLNDPQKLNFLIDLSKGDKAAITQLLKSHKIDPMDLDTEKDTGYQARNYQGDPQDNDFRDALDNALATPDGQALVSHIHKDWDKPSKAKLRENPSIIGNLSEMKANGVYDKVVEELNYQKSIGYLTDVPFLQAFDQVGEAMKNAGVFNTQPNPAQSGGNSMAPLNSGQPQSQPVASGARKSTGSKKPETNPHLSSTPPSKQTGNVPKTPDFDKLSDEEFLKMAPPE